MVLVGPDLFVTNDNVLRAGGSSVTEVNASTGALVRVISGASYHFDWPDAVAAAGPDLFVASAPSSGGSSISAVDTSTGALARVLSSQYPYQFDGPAALVADGTELFVANPASSTYADDRIGGRGAPVQEPAHALEHRLGGHRRLRAR
jgi:hypothetical protein